MFDDKDNVLSHSPVMSTSMLEPLSVMTSAVMGSPPVSCMFPRESKVCTTATVSRLQMAVSRVARHTLGNVLLVCKMRRTFKSNLNFSLSPP